MTPARRPLASGPSASLPPRYLPGEGTAGIATNVTIKHRSWGIERRFGLPTTKIRNPICRSSTIVKSFDAAVDPAIEQVRRGLPPRRMVPTARGPIGTGSKMEVALATPPGRTPTRAAATADLYNVGYRMYGDTAHQRCRVRRLRPHRRRSNADCADHCECSQLHPAPPAKPTAGSRGRSMPCRRACFAV
jgi:hypothetical protein